METSELKKTPGAPPLGGTVIVASLVVNILGLALPLVMLQIFDRVVPNQAIETLFVLMLGLTFAILLDFTLKVCRILLATQIGEDFERSATAGAIDHMFNTRTEAHGQVRDTDRFEAISSVGLLRDHYGGEGRLALIDLPFAIIFVMAVAWIGGPLALVLAASFVILIAMSILFRWRQKQVHAERKTIDGRRYSFFTEFLSNIHIVKSNCMETSMLRRYELLQEQSIAASRRLITVNGMSQGASASMGQATQIAVALTGGAMVINGSLGVAELAACTLLSGRAIQPMFKLTGMWVQGESVAAAKRRCGELLALPKRSDENSSFLAGAISFQGVSLKLKSQKAPLFQDLSFSCRPGECLALTGDDGAGKTTMLRLILGEQSPTDGQVLLDGVPAAEMLGARGQGGVAYLGQKPLIFETSILQNLTLSNDPERMDRAIKLAGTLGLSEAINKLPKGYETIVGGKGAMPLPEGILQLIALVRALAMSPKIVLFNEANTAMDSRTDQAALTALRNLKGKATLIIVSRRPSFVAIADRQINLTVGDTTIRRLDDLAVTTSTTRPASAHEPHRRGVPAIAPSLRKELIEASE